MRSSALIKLSLLATDEHVCIACLLVLQSLNGLASGSLV